MKPAPQLPDELKKCVGNFEVECRGVGGDYKPEELRTIQSALGGSVDGSRNPADLVASFKEVVERTKGLSCSNVMVQIWTPVGAKVTSIKQMTPQLLDPTGKVQPGPTPRLQRIDTGAWGEEARDYMVVVDLAPEAVGQVGGPGQAGGLHFSGRKQQRHRSRDQAQRRRSITAEWTDDDKKSTVINPKVANYTGQAELAPQHPGRCGGAAGRRRRQSHQGARQGS